MRVILSLCPLGMSLEQPQQTLAMPRRRGKFCEGTCPKHDRKQKDLTAIT